MNTNQLRKSFLEYFQQHQHTIVPSSGLIPLNDPTLLFTNAGMVQFKEVFLGNETRPYVRATSAQRCVRAGGKHNDLENVGYTARHHTFFEMLGNFSFGNYFKREAIQFAWQFLTEVLQISPQKLWVTVFTEDDETADIWLKEMKIDPQRFSRCGAKDNFWSMGDTGPCGPCTEIFYDHGPEVPGGPPGSHDADGDRYIEIWNLVFMQFNRTADGKLTPLPKPSVDTGMGLERIAAVMQGVHSNYDIDIFRHLLAAIAELANMKSTDNTSMRVIADHIRSTAFLITDGVVPSNEGRGYVLRRIIRRAVRHGYKLGLHEPFFYRLVAPLVKEMGGAYLELAQAQARVEQVLKQEEIQFANTLSQGLKIFDQAVADLPNAMIPGEVIFRLYDTYGFPPDLTNDIARERNLNLDYAGFEQEMAKQRQQSQAASKFAVDYTQQLQVAGETEFIGYDRTTGKGIVTSLLAEGHHIPLLMAGKKGVVVLDQTPFYAEAGGQVGDTGWLYFENGSFRVDDTRKHGLVYFHYGHVASGELQVGMQVTAEVDSARQATMLNHSATHLLHAALRHVLGEHVIQKGSLVAPDRLRFDFAHHEALTSDQITAIEQLVNQQIRANLASHVEVMSPEAAKQKGAIALFGEKYGDQVRVLSMGEFSMELCGGTHVARTGDIGLFKIISESGVAAGIRRIEAITGEAAYQWSIETQQRLQAAADLLKANSDNIIEKLQQLIHNNRQMEKELAALQTKLWSGQSTDLAAQAVPINDIKVLITKITGADMKTLRLAIDQLKDKLNKGVILLAAVNDDQVQLLSGVTKNCVELVNASELVGFVAGRIGGKGGGRPDMAQGGGHNIAALDAALTDALAWVKDKIK